MHDNLTNYLVDRTRSSTPFVIKYVPYGSLEEVGRHSLPPLLFWLTTGCR
jgi:hypothetical protein